MATCDAAARPWQLHGRPGDGRPQSRVRRCEAGKAQREQRAGRGHAPGKSDVADDQERQQAAQEDGAPGRFGLTLLRPLRQGVPGRRDQVGDQRQQKQPSRDAVLGQQLQDFVVHVVVGFQLGTDVLVERLFVFPGAGADPGQRMALDHPAGHTPHDHANAQRRVADRNRAGTLESSLQRRHASTLGGQLGVAGGDQAQTDHHGDQHARHQRLGAAAPRRESQLSAVQPGHEGQQEGELQPQCSQRAAGAGHQDGDDHQAGAGGQQHRLGTLPGAGDQQRRERQRADRELGEEVAIDEGRCRMRTLREQAQVDQELQRRPQRRHDSAAVNAPGQQRQAFARQRVQAQPKQQRKKEPADGLDTGQVGVRPGHAAQRIGHQQQRQHDHRVPAQGIMLLRAPEKQQSGAQGAERDDDGLEGVLQHLFIGHAQRRRQEHDQREDRHGASAFDLGRQGLP